MSRKVFKTLPVSLKPQRKNKKAPEGAYHWRVNLFKVVEDFPDHNFKKGDVDNEAIKEVHLGIFNIVPKLPA